MWALPIHIARLVPREDQDHSAYRKDQRSIVVKCLLKKNSEASKQDYNSPWREPWPIGVNNVLSLILSISMAGADAFVEHS